MQYKEIVKKSAGVDSVTQSFREVLEVPVNTNSLVWKDLVKNLTFQPLSYSSHPDYDIYRIFI
jgi:hypothetical protein